MWKYACSFQLLFLLTITTFSEVDQRSGRMIFTQDLAAIQSNSVQLQLKLSYSSGVRTNDRATWLGMGFDLNLPHIERYPNGSVDEKSGEFICSGEGYYSPKSYSELIKENGNGYVEILNKGDYTNDQDFYSVHGIFDDQIMFANTTDNTKKLSAYFVRTRPYRIDYRIDANKNIYKWEITDDGGIIYTFGGDANEGIVTAETRYNNGNRRCTGFSMKEFDGQKIYPEYYVNSTFNMRWYLTRIQSPNGDCISVSYTSKGVNPLIDIRDLYNYAWEEGGRSKYNDHLPVTSIFRPSNNKAIFTRGFDVYSIWPIFPIEIVGLQSKVKFNFIQSPSNDVLFQGNKCIDNIENYVKTASSSYALKSRIKFKYNCAGTNIENGLAVGHKYSNDPTKGLLALGAITGYNSDASKSILIANFEYRNPVFGEGYYRHDFYGYYRGVELKRTAGPFVYPAGQTVTGSADSPGAEAWSIWRVGYGTGKIEEYTYEPNEATMLTTNESIGGGVLYGGIRVKEMKIYSGVSSQPQVLTYSYGTGYATYNFALRDVVNNQHSITSFYSLLNRDNGLGDCSIDNVLSLQGIGIEYSDCTEQQTAAGTVKVHFLNPSNNVIRHIDEQAIPLHDVHVIEDGIDFDGINSYSHCRGSVWKIEKFKGNNFDNPIEITQNQYWAMPKLFLYYEPDVEPNEAMTCPSGEPDYVNPFEGLEDCIKNRYAGYVILKATTTTRDKIIIKNENLSYFITSEGIPIREETKRATNSNGEQKLTKIKLAHLEKESNGTTDAYPGMLSTNIINLPSGSITYRKAPGDLTTNPSNVCAAQAITYSNSLGSETWVPYKLFAWKVNMDNNWIPDPSKPFTEFLHSAGSLDPNYWQFTSSTDSYSLSGLGLQSTNAVGVSTAIVLSNDNSLQIATITNARHGECLFTNWAENIPATVTTTTGMADNSSPQDLHFAPRTLRVITNLANPKADLYAATAPTPLNNGVQALSGRTFLVQFWAKGDSPHKTYVHLQAYPSYVWSSYPVFEVTAEWKRYEFEMEFPANDASKQYRLVLRPPYDPEDESYVSGTIFYDDVRVFPKDAQAQTIYYDPIWRTPILTLDANNQPSELVENDEFGRPISWYKLNSKYGRSDANFKILKKKKEYYLMGQN